jgi:hypothetical protein
MGRQDFQRVHLSLKEVFLLLTTFLNLIDVFKSVQFFREISVAD